MSNGRMRSVVLHPKRAEIPYLLFTIRCRAGDSSTLYRSVCTHSENFGKPLNSFIRGCTAAVGCACVVMKRM